MLRNILYGLIPAQVIAFFHVYFSNLKLYGFLTAADRAGYLIVPGHDVTPGLQSLGAAFGGGLFFTLTVGAGLSILSYGLCWLWINLLKRNRYVLILITVVWLFTILVFNINGFALFPSLYLVIIPIIVFLTALSSISRQAGKKKILSAVINFTPVLVLAVFWTMEIDEKVFLDIRDNLLLSNRVGREINGFYYRYTLYPAEAFKTLEQKQLKGCYIEPLDDRTLTARLENELLNYDYLILDSPAEAHLRAKIEEGILCFISGDETVLRVPVMDFFRDPGTALKTYSQKTDTNSLFRRYLVFPSLLGGFPLLIYLIPYSFLAGAIRFFVHSEWSGWIASALCLAMGLMVIFSLQADRSYDLSPHDIGKTLEAAEWRQRTVALKLIVEKNLEIGEFSAYKTLLTSPHIAERYWLARAIGRSRRHSTMVDIIALLDDPHPNVKCMALEALGRRRDKRSIPVILEKIKSAEHWYIEWYAYRTLRTLGWKQKRLN